jgi:hypothetical protein
LDDFLESSVQVVALIVVAALFAISIGLLQVLGKVIP